MTTSTNSPYTAVIGVGYCVPDMVRGNDAPVFKWINAHPPENRDLFAGLKYRRVLADDETVVDIMHTASVNALADAGLAPAEVDMLLGYGTVAEYNAPNALAELHHRLELPPKCRVLPVATAYTNFHDSMKLAHDLIQAGTIRNALVACGNNWTRHVDYHEAVCVAAGDGAGAAVVGPTSDPSRFRLMDWENITDSSYYGSFRMQPRPIAEAPPSDYGNFTRALMKLDDPRGAEAFKQFGLPVPPRVVNTLLKRHQLDASEITLVAHQTSAMVQDHWHEAIKPANYLSTLTKFADMVTASVPVNLAYHYDQIQTDHLVLLGVGMEMHATALLYRRG